MSIIGTIATLAVSTLVPGAGLALAIYRYGKDVVLGTLKEWGKWLFLHPMTAVAIALGLLSLFWWQDARHWKKVDTGNIALIASVKKEVDRGVCQRMPKGMPCKPTQAADAPVYIAGFIDDLATIQDSLDRQTALLNAAKAEANTHVTAAHEAAQPTPAQGERDKVRQKIADPARTTGLTADEWGKL